jgi:hypothetical protein
MVWKARGQWTIDSGQLTTQCARSGMGELRMENGEWKIWGTLHGVAIRCMENGVLRIAYCILRGVEWGGGGIGEC